MANPSVADFLDTSNTVNTQRTHYTDILEEAYRNPGGLNTYPVEDVIGFSVLPPTACFAVQPQGGAGSAELRAIDPTGISIGQSIWIRAAVAGAPVTVKDGVAGTGRILLNGARDFVLAAADQWLQLVLASATHWEEASRGLPPLATPQEISDGTSTEVRSLTPALLKNVLPQTATSQEMQTGTETALRSVSPALIRAGQYQAATSQEMQTGTETALRSVSPALVRAGQYQQATAQEISDGTEEALRSFSPKDLADSGAIHGGGGTLAYIGTMVEAMGVYDLDLPDGLSAIAMMFRGIEKSQSAANLRLQIGMTAGGALIAAGYEQRLRLEGGTGWPVASDYWFLSTSATTSNDQHWGRVDLLLGANGAANMAVNLGANSAVIAGGGYNGQATGPIRRLYLDTDSGNARNGVIDVFGS